MWLACQSGDLLLCSHNTEKQSRRAGRASAWASTNVGPLISIQLGIIGLCPQDKYALSGQNLLNVPKGHEEPEKHAVYNSFLSQLTKWWQCWWRPVGWLPRLKGALLCSTQEETQAEAQQKQLILGGNTHPTKVVIVMKLKHISVAKDSILLKIFPSYRHFSFSD